MSRSIRIPAGWPVAAGLVVLGPWLGAGSEVRASSLTVQGGTTHTGSWAARVDIARTCSQDDVSLADGTDYGGVAEEEACVTLSADDVDVLAGGDVIFRAGERIVLGSGFSVASGASFRAVAGPEVAGTAFVESGQIGASQEYWARFYVFPDLLDLSGTDSFLLLVGLRPTGDEEFAVGVKRNGGMSERRVYVEAVEDDATVVTTEGSNELVLGDDWHFVEVRWLASSGLDDGVVEVCIDDSPEGGTSCAALSALDNDAGRLDAVRWGALQVPMGDLGTLFLDDFRAQRLGPIGGCSAPGCP